MDSSKKVKVEVEVAVEVVNARKTYSNRSN